MRLKNISFLFVFCLGVHTSSFAQHYQISGNPLGVLISSLGGKMAFKVSPKVAITLPFGFQFLAFWASQNTNAVKWGGYIGAGGRIFLSDTALKTGWFIEPNLKLGYSLLVGAENGFYLQPGFMGGYGWVFDSGFTINLGLGVTLVGQYINQTRGFIIYPWPEIEASLGYTW